MGKSTILIIEDEEAIADLLVYGLKKEGFHVLSAHNGTEGLQLIKQTKPDLLLLDWMLPDLSGLEICRKVTQSHNLPIIMITAKSDITDKVVGLEFGVDDYITKPFDMREVVARIRAILRRMNQAHTPSTELDEHKLRFLNIEVIPDERIVKKDDRIVELTPKEFDLLMALYKYKGKIFTRAELLDFVWGYDYVGDTRTVDIHIQRLRKKLDLTDQIITVFGIGYKFERQVDARHDSDSPN